MMVIFVAQCEKKALKRTRRILDSFANRIGGRTWQTLITAQGLKAVKKLLRKTASKNTAVTCHWTRSRSCSELLWIVGNRAKFNSLGFVAVNSTQQSIINTQWENSWQYLPLIKSLSALAGLFHDWGKASEFFQEKLTPKSSNTFKGDPVRHEWVTALLLKSFIDGEDDSKWLGRLARGEISATVLQEAMVRNCEYVEVNTKPLAGLPDAATLLLWLLVSHHRLPLRQPLDKNKPYYGEAVSSPKELLGEITREWGYENTSAQCKESLEGCFRYPKGLPCGSKRWLRYAQRWAHELRDNLELLQKAMADGSWRLILHHSRLAFMLADHKHSSLEPVPHRGNSSGLFANTDPKTGALKQTLGEHLLGVAKLAVQNSHLLPAFEGRHKELARAYDVKGLKRKSPPKFRWQDKAVTRIGRWREQHGQRLDSSQFGFFAVNMASTGTGKTIANAKIIRALSPDQDSLRYVLALGLRTLTLQTGDEYRERIGLEEEDLGVLIGSRAVLALHKNNMQHSGGVDWMAAGAESGQSLLENEFSYESDIPVEMLSTVLKDKKSCQFCYTPVLSCTIDHLMAATETRRSGRYILPALRLMSSDLVLDEVDDFDGKDLIAIGRLIHLAGMLGRKVMIASATIPPDLAEGFFNAYQAGWMVFASMGGREPHVGCAWIDEFGTEVEDINHTGPKGGHEKYRNSHERFVRKRLGNLQKEIPKRRATIIPCRRPAIVSKDTLLPWYFSLIQEAIVEKHLIHCVRDEQSGKLVSFGVVRMANISPCVELTRYLLRATFPKDIEIRTMAYHSRQILIMRNEQERHLDQVLKRDQGEQAAFQHKEIRSHLDAISASQVIFILVVSPVEEVGRDHDFDWAVVEPSSSRSFIQLAGRVRRHRGPQEEGTPPNMGLLQYNLKSLLQGRGRQPVFCRPGYESADNLLESHDLCDVLDEDLLAQNLDARSRIQKPNPLRPTQRLADLEHEVIAQLLTSYGQQGPEALQGWLTGYWWLTAVPQYFVKFRAGQPQRLLYLIPRDGEWCFAEKVAHGGDLVVREESYRIRWEDDLPPVELGRLWLHRDYQALLERECPSDPKRAALVYGEIGIPADDDGDNERQFSYSHHLGMVQK